MIKKWILVFFVSFLFGCSISSQSQSTDSIINPADRQIWIPADDNELEQRRVLQARFDQIAEDIESLFLRLDILDSDEITMRGGMKKINPYIESMGKTVSGMIKQEESRVNNLGQELDGVRQNNKIFNSEIEILNRTIKPDPVFSPRTYVDAFVSFRKGQYAKSANLFRKALQSNPPYELTDNLLFGLGMSQYRLGNISKVSKPLSRLISKYPGSEKWYMSHLVLALTHYKKREKSQALYVLQKGLKKNPPYFIRSMFMNLNTLIHK